MLPTIDWNNVTTFLRLYAKNRDSGLGNKIFRFLYHELAEVVPRETHDALQEVLSRLHADPTKLGEDVKSPKAWFRRAVLNQVIDDQKANNARREREGNWAATYASMLEKNRLVSNALIPVRDCVERLDLKRRVVLKLYYLDTALTSDEISYLCEVHACSEDVIRSRIDGVVDAENSLSRSYQLSLIIEPDKGSSDAQARERRLDRFRKARKTAENELKACLGVQI